MAYSIFLLHKEAKVACKYCIYYKTQITWRWIILAIYNQVAVIIWSTVWNLCLAKDWELQLPKFNRKLFPNTWHNIDLW